MGSYATGRYVPFRRAQTMTKLALLAGALVYVAYDIFAYRNAKNDSISAVSMSEMYLHPAYTVMLGALMGHLTWPAVAARQPAQSLKYVVPTMIGLALWDHYMPVEHPVWPIWPFVTGIPIGHFMFPQDISTQTAVLP